MKTAVKSSLKFVLSVLIIILITLVFMEIGLRIFPGIIPLELLYRFNEEPRAEIARKLNLPTQDDTVLLERDDEGPLLRVFKPHTEITYKFRDPGVANTVVMDKTGFCNPPENSYDSPTVDIITVGDSFTWCTTVAPEDTWTSRLTDLTNLSTYNLGMRGIGLYEYLQILKQFGLPKSPQIVIMNVYEGNDLRDAFTYQTRRGLNWESVQQEPNLMIYKFSNPSARYSYTYNLISAAIDGLRTLGYLNPAPPPPNFRYYLATENNRIGFNPENVDADEVIFARQLQNQEISLEVFSEALKTYVSLSEQFDFVPVVVYTPSAYTAYATHVMFDDPALPDLMTRFSTEQRDFFKAKANELAYIFIDLTPALQAATQAENTQDNLLYFQTNLHLTPGGM